MIDTATAVRPAHAWAEDAFFYHLYPLGCFGAPARNDYRSAPVPRLAELHGWLDHLQALGITALYLGPVFESTAHGYDTVDYYRVDRRLGDAGTLKALADDLHARGMKLVLDGVFNHVGRDHAAFRDVRKHGVASRYAGWFHLDPSKRSPCGDAFSYEGWHGHYDLVKLNTSNPEVRAHLFGAVKAWIEAFDLDGLRLDAADVLDLEFQAELAAFCRALKPDFWLMGEVIHGMYSDWTTTGGLDSVTNYNLYKAFWSSHNDRNYFELAHQLDRQFGPSGIYRGMNLYNFVDNHDVERIGSILKMPREHLEPLHALLLTLPGSPSLYYGSETAVPGKKEKHSDTSLRPRLRPDDLAKAGAQPNLADFIARWARHRRDIEALRRGTYQTLLVTNEQLAFARRTETSVAVVAVNMAREAVTLRLPVRPGSTWKNVETQAQVRVMNGVLDIQVPKLGACLVVQVGEGT